jgi:hypothetical protein
VLVTPQRPSLGGRRQAVQATRAWMPHKQGPTRLRGTQPGLVYQWQVPKLRGDIAVYAAVRPRAKAASGTGTPRSPVLSTRWGLPAAATGGPA